MSYKQDSLSRMIYASEMANSIYYENIMSTNSFLGVFAKSPLKPIEDHIDLVDQCTQLLAPFFECVFQCDWTQAEKVQQLDWLKSFEKKCKKCKKMHQL